MKLILIGLFLWPALPRLHASADDHLNKNFYVCESTECQARAKLINESLNTSVDPCEDFYSYACGGWLSKYGEGRTLYGVYEQRTEQIRETLKTIFENMTIATADQSPAEKAGVFFKSCSAFQEQNIGEDIRYMLRAVGLGEWPLIGDNVTNVKNWTNCSEVLLDVGMFPVFDIDVKEDKENSTAHIMHVNRYIILEEDDEGLESYKAVIRQLVNLTKPETSEPLVTDFVESMITFERQLVNLSQHPKQWWRDIFISNRTTIESLEMNFTNIPLLSLVNKEFNKVGINVTAQESVEVRTLYFYEKLNGFLESTDPVTLYNYGGIRALYSRAERTIEKIRKLLRNQRKPNNSTRREAEKNPWWEQCITLLEKGMEGVLDCVYVDHSASADDKYQVEEIARRIKETFRNMIGSTSWLDTTTKDYLLRKLDALETKFGYPEWRCNETYLRSLYQHVPDLDPNSSFQQVWHMLDESKYRRQLKKLRESVKGKDTTWDSRAYDTTARHFLNHNRIEIPWGLLHAPFYQRGLPWSMNLGGIGTVIAHELMHGAGITGFRRDKNVTADSRREFEETANCFVDQYGNLPLPGAEKNLTVPGRYTLNENIADNGGLGMALNAYIQLLQEECENNDTRLAGLEHLSGLQLFFIGNAMTWCRAKNAQGMLWAYIEDHSPEKYRVNVPMQNLEAFAESFKCPKNSAMKKEKNETCTLW